MRDGSTVPRKFRSKTCSNPLTALCKPFRHHAAECTTASGNHENTISYIKQSIVHGSPPFSLYQRATASGKRAQCQGGAKNPVIIMPDAELETAIRIMADSAFGCAGQRRLAASVAVTVGDAQKRFGEAIAEVPDGRGKSVNGYESGNWVFPTVLDAVDPASTAATTEIFGPVLSLMHASSLEQAISLVNDRAYGNMACIFTTSGATAREFRSKADAGNVGINIGVAAPMAYFPFSGWNESFFGDLHAQGRHGVEFYTQTKVVVERWPGEWSRKF
jgi:malonate-semialdehyde dehydrogenase (acetylating)/methylmalonate-semialdehyde dehydrogenase